MGGAGSSVAPPSRLSDVVGRRSLFLPISYILGVEMLTIFFACGGQARIACARLSARPPASPGHCLVKSGRSSLVAYKAIAYK